MSEYDRRLLEYVRQLDRLGLQHNFAVSAETVYDLECNNATRFNFFIAGRSTGHAIISTDHNAKYATWVHFYPLLKKTGLERRGVGTLAHVTALKTLVEQEQLGPGYTVIHTSPTKIRLAQMAEMGLQRSEPLRDYMKKSVDYANRKGFDFRNPFQ
ncbi:MAG TPA: hypothetical protein VJH04_02585 [archaeon]|nr:hypothetical protein [archaeon]